MFNLEAAVWREKAVQAIKVRMECFQKTFIAEAEASLFRVRKEINGTCIHLIFRPSLADLQSRNPQNSTTIPPVPLIQIDPIRPKSQRLHVPRISLRTLGENGKEFIT